MHELLTTEEMGRADQLTIEGGTPGAVLMENAGQGVAAFTLERFSEAKRISILCGPGNNGGDGFVAARLFQESGRDVRVALLGQMERLKGDAALMASKWEGPVDPFGPASIEGSDVIIDAIFGAGLMRPVEGAVADLIDRVNAMSVPVIAVDVPTGIDGTTGEVKGTAIKAAGTVTFFRRKLGHLLIPGRIFCGVIRCVDIGIPDHVLDEINPKIFANEPDQWLSVFPWPQLDGHKYSRGHTLVVSGQEQSTGAARLGAMAALRAGSGLVTVASPPGALTVNAAQLTAVMVRAFEGVQGLEDILSDRRKNAVLIGPGVGVGERTREHVLAILRSDAGIVLDADALTSFSETPETLFDAIKSRSTPVLITPHEGEFARLFPSKSAGNSKLSRAEHAAALSGATVILKGPDTVIASPDGQAAINATGTPWLATAGSGDVLGGIAAGLLAQHMAPFEGACAAVWMHAKASEIFGPGLIAEDLNETMPAVLRELHALRKQ